MCGISGIVYFENSQPAEQLLKQMTNVIHHRGPDDSGFWIEDRVGLGFRRLSIIDLQEGHQPLSNEDDKVWIVFNGEIYNYKALREQLESKGHRFKTNSDTEVIVHAYEEFGEDCVKQLRGMFSFAIWDKRTKTLFGARDHFGIKPFYYFANAQKFLFASEIKSILAAGEFERTVETESLIHYLTFQYVPEPLTMFQGIKKLQPAHTITVLPTGETRIRRYWDPSFAPEERPAAEMIEELRARLQDSVVHHMQSDVNRGCFLSSGIDSTAIAAHMRKVEPIKTFSVGFEGPNNETTIAYETAKALGTEHYAKIITEQDFFDAVPTAAWHQDEPVADPSAIALYHVAKLAKEHVTVVLSGEGADELFGGYRIYREPTSLRPLSWLPLPLKRWLHRLAQALPACMYGRNYILRGTTPLEERFLGNAKIFTGDLKREILNLEPEQYGRYLDPFQVTKPYYDLTRHLDPATRMQYIDLNLWLPGDILMKADKMTMANSLELRVPFLDKELFELARRIPVSSRIAEGTTKYIFRKAMEGIIPDFILDRPKLGFPVPLRHWLKGTRGDNLLELIKASGISSYVDIKLTETLLQKHKAGQGDYSRNLWVLYMFGLWHQTYIQGQGEKAKALSAAI